MKRYSKKTLASMTAAEFACDVLLHELEQRDPETAVARKLTEAIDQLEQEAAARMSYASLSLIFRIWEKAAMFKHLTAYITFTTDSFDEKDLPLMSRTYRVSSDNKGYQPGKANNSIYGSCLDGSDPHCHLHLLMEAEQGGKRGWRVEYCQLVEEGEQVYA